MKRNFIFLLTVFILFTNLGFVNSLELIDFSEKLGLKEGEIKGEGMKLENNHFSFAEEGANLEIKGNKFENIKPSGEKLSIIELDEKGEITKAAFTSKGGCYTFGNTRNCVDPDTRILFDKEIGITIIPSDGSKLTETPQSLNQPGIKDYITTIECIEACKTFTLSDGTQISGKIRYQNGQAYVDSTSGKVVINGVELSPAESRTNIFFDGKRHEGERNYLSFGERNLIISSSEGKSPVVNFKGDSPYLRIDEGDHVAMQTLTSIRGGGEIEIQNRDPKLIPRVVTKGNFRIEQDSKSLVYKDGLFGFNPESVWGGGTQSTTSPIELISFNNKGGRLFGGDKILVDNFNRFAFFVPENDLEFTSLQEGIPIKFSARIKYNYPSEEIISELTGKKLIFNDVPQGNKDLVLGRLRDYWDTLTPETKEAITVIDFSSEEYFDNEVLSKKYSSDAQKTKAVTLKDKTMLFRSTGERFNLELFRHESAHVHHLNLDKIPNEAREKIRLERERLHREFKRLFDSKRSAKTESELIEINNKLSKLQGESIDLLSKSYKISQTTFLSKWKDIAGLSEEGFVKEYAKNSNEIEDIATFVEVIATNPGFFKELINPKNSKKYNVIYIEKIDLLHEHKFISTSEYNKVLQAAGIYS